MQKKYLKVVATAACALGIASSSFAAEATIGVDFASAYVFRGATLNDGFVAQPYMELGGFPNDLGLTLGAWGNFDLESSDAYGLDSGNFSEIDLYGSYELPLGIENLSSSVGYTEYTYPNAGGMVMPGATPEESTVMSVEADREVNLVLGYDTLLAPSLGIYYGFDGGVDGDLYLEGAIGHEEEFEGGVTGSVGATLGYLSPDEGTDGLSHLTLNAGVAWNWLSAGVYWIVETDDDVLTVDEEFVGVVGASYSY